MLCVFFFKYISNVEFAQEQRDEVKMPHRWNVMMDDWYTRQNEDEMGRSWREAEGAGTCRVVKSQETYVYVYVFSSLIFSLPSLNGYSAHLAPLSSFLCSLFFKLEDACWSFFTVSRRLLVEQNFIPWLRVWRIKRSEKSWGHHKRHNTHKGAGDVLKIWYTVVR